MAHGTLDDPYLYVVGPDGQVLAEDDDSAGDLNARIDGLLLTATGDYTIEATGYSSSSRGSYTLQLTGGSTPAPQFTVRVTRTGSGTGTVTASGGIDCGSTCVGTYPAGTQLTLTARPDSTSRMGAFTGACQTGSTTCTFTVTANVTVTVAFEALISIQPMVTLTITRSGTGTGTVSSSPSGISCGNTCVRQFTAGTTITLTGTPDANSQVLGFSGGCQTGASSCAFVLTRDATVAVTFDRSNPTAVIGDFVSMNQLNSVATPTAAYFRYALYYNSQRTPSFQPYRLVITIPSDYGMDVLQVPEILGMDLRVKVRDSAVTGLLGSLTCLRALNLWPVLACGVATSVGFDLLQSQIPVQDEDSEFIEEDAGMTVEYGDFMDMCRALHTLVTDSFLRQQMGQVAKEKLAIRHDQRKITRQLIEILSAKSENGNPVASAIVESPAHALP